MIKIDYRYIFIFVAFLLVLVIQYLSPMQSDDFAFYQKGISLQSSINLYYSWSGRLISDFISSFLLNFDSKFMTAIACSIAVVLLFVFIAALPNGRFTLTSYNLSTILIISLLYWIDNPALGQTTFWVVGGANYLWTSLLYLPYILMLYRRSILAKDDNLALLLSISFLAGITNENIGVTLIALSIASLIYIRFNKGVIDYRIIIMTVCLALGTSLLLFAPGNYVRASFASDWYSLPVEKRIYIHFLQRLPTALLEIKYTLFLIFSLSFLVKNKRDLLLPLVLVACGLFSLFVLVGAPNVGERSINGSFILFLLSLSFILKKISNTPIIKITISVLISILLMWFCVSYFYIFNTYSSLHNQEKIRVAIIRSGGTLIPDFFTGKLLKNTDGIDTWFNGEAMGWYYKTSTISKEPILFDYQSVLFGKAKKISFESHSIISDIFYENGKIVFSFQKKYLPEVTVKKTESYYLHIIDSKGESHNNDFTLPITCIFETCYLSSFDVNREYEDIGKIYFGKYNPTTEKPYPLI